MRITEYPLITSYDGSYYLIMDGDSGTKKITPLNLILSSGIIDANTITDNASKVPSSAAVLAYGVEISTNLGQEIDDLADDVIKISTNVDTTTLYTTDDTHVPSSKLMDSLLSPLQTASHTHSNKSVLDNILAIDTSSLYTTNDKHVPSSKYISSLLSPLQTASHTHSNKSVLDGIAASDITSWNAKMDKAVPTAANNIALLDANGNVTDGGHGLSYFINTSQVESTLTQTNSKVPLSIAVWNALSPLQTASHTHSNKSVLDGIAASDITSWNAKIDLQKGVSNPSDSTTGALGSFYLNTNTHNSYQLVSIGGPSSAQVYTWAKHITDADIVIHGTQDSIIDNDAKVPSGKLMLEKIAALASDISTTLNGYQAKTQKVSAIDSNITQASPNYPTDYAVKYFVDNAIQKMPQVFYGTTSPSYTPSDPAIAGLQTNDWYLDTITLSLYRATSIGASAVTWEKINRGVVVFNNTTTPPTTGNIKYNLGQLAVTIQSDELQSGSTDTYLWILQSYTGVDTYTYNWQRVGNDKPIKAIVTLEAANWHPLSKSQAITVSGVTADSIVYVSPAWGYMEDAANSKIYCSGQSSDTLVFTCLASVPASDVDMNVVIMN